MQTDELRPGFTAAGRFAFRGQAMLTASELEGELATLIGMIRRLSPPLSQRPALFLEQKDELARYAESIRDRAAGRAPSERSFAAPTADTGVTTISRGGRVTKVERTRKAHFVPRGT